MLAAEQPHLHRRFGLFQATALNMSNMVGVGPFITIPILMGCLNGGGPQSMLGWLVGLIIALPDGLIWAELGAAMPGSGGSYIYLREGFGPQKWGRLMAFLFIWQFILSGPLEIGSGFIGLKQYIRYFWPNTPDSALTTRLQIITVALGIACIALLYRRITSVAKITVTLWIGMMLTVGIVIFGGAGHFNPKIAFDFPPHAFDFSLGFVFGLGAAARIGIYDYLGYYDVCYIGDEVKNPGKTIPRSILISLIAIALIYITMNLSIIGVVPWREFTGKDPAPPIASMFVEKLFGTKFAIVFTALILWTTFASIFALMLGYSRIPYAAAKDGYFFKPFAKLHPKKDFPHISLLLIGGLAIVSSFLSLDTVIDALITLRILVQFIAQIGAVALLRKHSARPDVGAPVSNRPHEFPFRMWLYPLPSLIALIGWLFLFVTALFDTDKNQIHFRTSFTAYILGILAMGFVAFLIWSRRSRTWPFQNPSLRNSAPSASLH